MIDVCLLLEGTYPYVSGGVSTWVHQLVTSLKNLKFGIIFISPQSDPTRTPKYEIPPHVVYLKEISLHDYDVDGWIERRPKKKDFQTLVEIYGQFVAGKETEEDLSKLISLFHGDRSCLNTRNVFSSKQVWDALVEIYDKHAPTIPFLDYFWTWRGTHLPLVQVLKAELPPARIFHAVSTGYAGLLGAIARTTIPCRFFLTEHGIYTHERLLEISQANWIFEAEKNRYRVQRDLSFFKMWWVGLFRVMSRQAYRNADRIFTLFEGNKTRQVLEGASPSKITIIPNGIDVKSFSNMHRDQMNKESPLIALIGRVVSIKDVKTFIQAARLVLEKMPHARFAIMGPESEEEDYVEECRRLCESLGLERQLEFKGIVNMKEYYGKIDLVVLTSLSEGQPYVILEANACGIPVVASDVGACREMIEGLTLEDKSLGKSGLLTQVANPAETAQAIVTLLDDEEFYDSCRAAGRERVRRYYDQNDLLSRYMNAYEGCL